MMDFPHIFSLERKLKAIERELGYRSKVYPRRIAQGKMKQREADEEIGVLEAIADDYRRAIDVKGWTG